jgi:hypothetical protein
MIPESHYESVSVAINELKKKGFDIDFNLKENQVVCHMCQFDPSDLEIVEIYRYEGNSDPSDEAIVYALESKDGMKGLLVNGYGVSSDYNTSKIMKQIKVRE